MRRRTAAAVVILMALLAAAPAAPAKPRLDRSFGVHHGHWERGGAAWGTIGRVLPGRDGTALVLGEDGRVARIGADGRPDARWGSAGTLRLAGHGFWPAGALPAARWAGGYAFVTPDGRPLAVDRRGRRRPVTDALAAAITPTDSVSVADRLVPDPDGSLWHLRTATRGDGLLQRLGRDGRPRGGAPVTLPAGGPLGGAIDLVGAVATAKGIVAGLCDGGRERCSVRRLRADGTPDPRFRPVVLGATLTTVLPWHHGVVVVAETRVLWVDGRGRVVRRGPLAGVDAASLDAAARLLAVGTTRDDRYVTVRRLRADGTRDRSFGTVRLRVVGNGTAPLAVLAAPGGRVLVVGQALQDEETDFREDLAPAPFATVVWRLRTR